MKTKTPEQKFLFRVASEVKRKAKLLAPYDTRNLRRDIQVFDDNINRGEVEIGNTLLAPYAPYVHEGTGIYGKHKRRIAPKHKKALKTPYGLKKSVAGQKGQPYLLNAANEVLTPLNIDKMADSLADDVGEEIAKDFKVGFNVF